MHNGRERVKRRRGLSRDSHGVSMNSKEIADCQQTIEPVFLVNSLNKNHWTYVSKIIIIPINVGVFLSSLVGIF